MMTHHRLLPGLKTLIALPLVCLLLLPRGARAERAELAMAVPTVPAGAVDQGALPAGMPLDATLYLTPSAARASALEAFLAQLNEPSSPSYHQWLTPAQFGAQFGADAAQLAAVRSFVEGQGLRVTDISASGLRVTVHGTATQMEAAFAPALHVFAAASKVAYANTVTPAVPAALAGTIQSIGGFDTASVPTTTLLVDGAALAPTDLLSAFATAVITNTARVLALTTSGCAENIVAADAAAFSVIAKEAATQGMTLLASAACTDGGTVSFPATLAEVTSVALTPGLSQPVATSLMGQRPSWQIALGLPQNGLRSVPDLTVSSLAALAQTVQTMLAAMPAAATGTPARMGNLNVVLYDFASKPGLFTQPDGATSGTWELLTGLGAVSLDALGKIHSNGVNSTNVSISSSNYSPTHGQSFTLSSTVTDTSGQTNGAVATGTVTFTDSNGNILGGGAATLMNGTATVTVTGQVAGSLTVTASYSGDTNYAPNKSNAITFTIQPEAATYTATVNGSTQLGGNIQVLVTLKSASGVGTPTGTVYAQLQGVNGAGTESATLAGSNGTATATILVPALLAGNVTINVTCKPLDPSFTCYQTLTPTATVTPGTSTTALVVNPYPIGTGTETLTATVTGAASPAPTPTGNVGFYDNGNFVGNAQINNGVATYTGTIPTAATHNLTAKYGGDNNYLSSTSSGVNGGTTLAATNTTLVVNPTTPVNGSTTTLTASVSNGGAATTPSGIVQFYEDGGLIGAGTLANGIATFTSTTISGTASHMFYAVYQGDTLNATSQSATYTSPAAGAGAIATSTAISVATTTPTQGVTTTVTATVTVTGTAIATAPTGTVYFYSSASGLLGAAALNGTTASAAVTFTTVGAQNVYATYVGDTNYATSTSGNTAVTVAAGGTTTSATSTTVVFQQNAAYVGAGVQITAQIVITGAAKTAAPTGTVSFTDSVQGYLGSTGVAGSSYAPIFVIFNTAGTHTVTATYSGDANYGGSTGQASDNILAASTVATTTTLQFSTTTPTLNVPFTITTTVANAGAAQPTAPSGIVEYTDSVQGYLGYATLTGSTAQFSATFTTAGAHTVTATYLGNNVYSGSSATGGVTVGGGTTGTTATTTVVSVSTTTPTVGVATTLTATVASAVAGKTPAPTGTVNFYSSASGLLGSATLNGSTATLSAAFTIAGAQNVYATYVGDTNYTASTSATVAVTAAAGSTGATATTTTVGVSTPTPTVGVPFTLTATVASTVAGMTTSPTGSVNFYSSTQGYLGTAVINGTAATLSATLTTPGAQNIYATYVGDTNYSMSTSANVGVTAAAATTTATTTTVGISTANPTVGVPLTLTAAVASTVAGKTTTPTGTVNFYSSVQGFLGTATLNGTTATLSATLTTAGAQNIYATYAGDANYTTSTSANVPITVAATAATGPTQSIVISPASPVPYGAPVVVTVGLTGITLTSGTTPTGTETLTITPTGSILNSSVALVATTANSATATFTFTAPAPGSYVLTATCTGSNFTCSTTGTTTTLVVVKGNTTTTVTATPAVAVAGQLTTLTATIAPVAPSTGTNFTGLVTFYNNGVSLGTGTVTGATATFATTLNSTTGNVITAVYSGDTDWNTSTSTALNLVAPTTVTTGILTSNLTRALYTTNIILTANISVTPSTTVTNPTTAYGNVTFYDLYNGQQTTLGTGTLVSSGAYLSVAQISTIGLLPGTHIITAIFPSSTAFTGVTSNALVINITDYGLSFNPPTLTVKQGSSASATLTVNAINGFTGTVVLGCTPPSGTATTCSFSPAVLSPNGTSTLLITTTAPQVHSTLAAGLRYTGLGASFVALLGCLLVPKRRRPALLALVAMLGLLGAAGCTNIRDTGGSTVTTGSSAGTPLGTQIFTITTSGTDGVTTNRHDLQLQVTVQ